MSNAPLIPLIRQLRTNLGKIPSALLFLSLLLSTQAAQPARAVGVVLFVAPGGAESHSCDSWGNACELQYALGSVAVSGDQVWAQQGTYVPGLARSDTFTLLNGVGIYGGFVGSEAVLEDRDPAANVTVLSGEIGAGDTSDNSYHVVTGGGTDSTALLDGFTITAANANGVSTDALGGGMYNDSSSPTLTNVTLSGNLAYEKGGGMYNTASSPTLTNVTFSGNGATFGGGMANVSSGNPTLTNVVFSGNFGSSISYNYGGGMYNIYNSSPILTDVVFIGNYTVPGRAGGMYNYSASNPILTNVTFNGNWTADNGGGLANFQSDPTLTNVTFSGNSSIDTGGGISNYQSNSTLTNVTFSGNSAPNGGAMHNHTSSPTLKNTIIANSPSGGDCVNAFGSLNAASANNLIEDGANACGLTNGVNGNIVGQDPLLGGLADNGGLTQTMALGAGSPAINSGDVGSCPADDQRGVLRPQGTHCDIGAFERVPVPAVPADFDGELTSDVVLHRGGAWNFYDFTSGLYLGGSSKWTGNPGGACIPAPMDYDGDGTKDFTQLCSGAWNFYDNNGAFVKGIWVGNIAGLKPVPADYDGDGTEDIVVFNAGAWNKYDYTSEAYVSGVWTGNPGGNGIPSPMDYDGNGTADPTILSGGAWHFYNDNGSYNKGIWVGNIAGQMPVPGDYDGDGTDDVWVYRAGAWLPYNFTTGAYLGANSVWTGNPAPPVGGGATKPAPIDYDGDGTLDFTVFAGGPWHFYNDNGSYSKGIWVGKNVADVPISRRPLP